MVDDEEVFRSVLVDRLNMDPSISALGYESCESLLESLSKGEPPPDVILLDILLGGMNGLQGLGKIRRVAPDCRIVMLTGSSNDQDVVRAMKDGAFGFVQKTAHPEEIMDAVVRASHGERYLDAVSLNRYFEVTQGTRRQHANSISDREMEIVMLVVEGNSRKEIATRLGISEGTVVSHLESIYRKTGVRKNTELVAWAIWGNVR